MRHLKGVTITMNRFKTFYHVSRVFALMIVMAVAFGYVAAQATFTVQNAIDTAASHPVFADGLARYEDWTAAAYNTNNAYEIWRVQFWDSEGEDLAWADVSPARGKVYSYEAHFAASEQQTNTAYDVLRDFIDNEPQVLALVDDPSQYEIYVEYDTWGRQWSVYLDIDIDSLYFAVRFDGETPDDLENPELQGVYFPNVISYEEWQSGMEAQAIAIAFQDQAIADAVNGRSWTTEVEQSEDGSWRITFWEGDISLAEVVLDAAMENILDYSTE